MRGVATIQATLALTFLEHFGTLAQVIILDDKRAVPHEQAVKCDNPEAHGGAFYHGFKTSGPIEKFMTYTFDVNRDGCYLIEEYHPVKPDSCTNLDDSFEDDVPGLVPLRVDYCWGETAWTQINQAVGGGQWNVLGRLPFYKHGGEYSFSLREKDTPTQGRVWMADAFRLTWLAASCHEDDKAEAQAEKKPTPREVLSAEAEEVTDEGDVALASVGTSQVPAVVQEPSVAAAFQLLLNEPRDDGAHAKFFFKVPVDGCYMIEERHPHIDGERSGSFTVNYCKGLTAAGGIDHTNGKHDQWNYVAALPFFDDRDGSVFLPRELVARGDRQHHIRVTHVGSSCMAPKAQVHRAELRIQADFGLVQETIDSFKSSLMSLLDEFWLQLEGVHTSRVAITHVREGSIIAEVTVLPTSHGPSLSGPSSQIVVKRLSEYVASSEFQQKICTTAGSQNPSCTVSIFSSGRARPLVTRVEGQADDGLRIFGSNDDVGAGFWGLIIAGVALISLLCGCAMYRSYKRSPKAESSGPMAAKDITSKDDVVDDVKIIAVKKDVETQWEDSSTLTPDFDAAPTEDIEDIDEVEVQKDVAVATSYSIV